MAAAFNMLLHFNKAGNLFLTELLSDCAVSIIIYQDHTYADENKCKYAEDAECNPKHTGTHLADVRAVSKRSEKECANHCHNCQEAVERQARGKSHRQLTAVGADFHSVRNAVITVLAISHNNSPL